MKPPLLANESGRLHALAEYHILHTRPEQAFDDLATLAAQICGCPVALVTLIDTETQWFKAKVGWDYEQTPREHSFCAHAIADPTNLMVISDATADARFAGNPYVTGDPGIRFYAGAPLLTPECHALGSLCVIDRQPRKLTDAQLGALRILGRQVSYLLELRRVSHALACALDNAKGGGVAGTTAGP